MSTLSVQKIWRSSDEIEFICDQNLCVKDVCDKNMTAGSCLECFYVIHLKYYRHQKVCPLLWLFPIAYLTWYLKYPLSFINNFFKGLQVQLFHICNILRHCVPAEAQSHKWSCLSKCQRTGQCWVKSIFLASLWIGFSNFDKIIPLFSFWL